MVFSARGGPGRRPSVTAGSVCGRSASPRRLRLGRTQVAKGQKRSGREPKKPKQDKPKAKAAASPFAAAREKPLARPPGEKK